MNLNFKNLNFQMEEYKQHLAALTIPRPQDGGSAVISDHDADGEVPEEQDEMRGYVWSACLENERHFRMS